MTDTDRMVVWLREALDAAERRADRWHDVECDVHTTSLTDAAVLQSATLCDCGGPAAVLRRVAADRKTLDDCEMYSQDNLSTASLAEHVIRNLAEGWGWTEETETN
ncbi:hypothetical protein ACFXI6_14255 [Streptomyces mirabilis]|uniref:hypothetical protein n=1 Tax=Streptomyces mirabilis TaxID=68239 RepID=UPI0036B58EBB